MTHCMKVFLEGMQSLYACEKVEKFTSNRRTGNIKLIILFFLQYQSIRLAVSIYSSLKMILAVNSHAKNEKDNFKVNDRLDIFLT